MSEENWDDDVRETPKSRKPWDENNEYNNFRGASNYSHSAKNDRNNYGDQLEEVKQVNRHGLNEDSNYTDSKTYNSNRQARGGNSEYSDRNHYNNQNNGSEFKRQNTNGEAKDDYRGSNVRSRLGPCPPNGRETHNGALINYGNLDAEYPNYNEGAGENQAYGANRKGNENGDERPRPPVYTPLQASDNAEDVFAKHISEGIDFDKYKNVKVQVSGGDERVDCISSFDASFGINNTIIKNIKQYGYTTPTPIQKFAMPIILKEKYDIMGCAQTGSGKTAAFLIPIFSLMLDNRTSKSTFIASPQVVVIVPTRELASQIWSEMRKFAYGTPIRTGVVYGGVSRQFIERQISGGCDALAATPGRLVDLLTRGQLSLANLKYLVLDEADRMLDMGFIGDIRKILNTFDMPVGGHRRSYMLSATFPVEIQKLAKDILAPDYYFITVGMVGGAADSIKQEILQVEPRDKRDKLVEVLLAFEGSKVLVFVETKRSADFLTSFLCQKEISATSIHGDRYQEQREEALRSFTRGTTPVLVATSVAARGLDIPDVEVVINYDLPSDIDEYVHRIGRTGRLGNKGCAISFFTSGKDEHLSSPLVKILNNVKQEIPSFMKEDDYASGGATSNFVASRDDRGISKRVYKAYSSNQPREGDSEYQLPTLVEATDENWD